jgi:hypothetical protein
MKKIGKGMIVELPSEDIPHANYPHNPVDEWGNPKSIHTLGLRIFRREGKDAFGNKPFVRFTSREQAVIRQRRVHTLRIRPGIKKMVTMLKRNSVAVCSTG